MNSARVAYVINLDGLDAAQVASVCRSALELVAPQMDQAETDIPWAMRASWSADVLEAARRLCDAFVRTSRLGSDYMQTGVVSVADPQVRADIIAVAPHAYDATFWGVDGSELASLADEGLSCVVWLADRERQAVSELIGQERVIRLVDWNRSHPSLWRRWLSGLRRAVGMPPK